MQVWKVVVCINAVNVNLTAGNAYVVEAVGRTTIFVRNDLGKISAYTMARFSENAPERKAVPPPPPQIDWVEEGRKALQAHSLEGEPDGLSSFCIVHQDSITEHLDVPCHYHIRAEQQPVGLIYGLSCDFVQLGQCDHVLHKSISEYVLKESPFAEAFIDKDYDNGLKNELLMDANKDIHMLAGACIALRMGWEYAPRVLPTWGKLLAMGINKNISFLLASLLRYNKGTEYFEWGGSSHHMWIDQDMRVESLLVFMRDGYAKNRGVAPYTNSYTDYSVYYNIAERESESIWGFISRNCKEQFEGQGWNRIQIFDDEDVRNIAQLLTEKMENLQ